MITGFTDDPAGWDVQRYTNFLRCAVADLHSADALTRHRATEALGDGAAQPQTPRQLLARFGARLPEVGKLAYGAAVGLLLRQARPEWMSARAVSALVLLAGDLQAHEAIDAIVTAIAEGGGWGRRHPGLYVDALAVLKGMAGSELAWKPTWRLVGAEGFPKTAVFDACEVLVACRPPQWGSTFVRLESLFADVLEGPPPPLQQRSTAAWFDWRLGLLVQERLGSLTLPTLVEGLERLHGPPELGPEQLRRLDFGRPVERLVLALLDRRGHPYQLRHGADGDGLSEVIRVTEPAMAWPWPETLLYFDVYVRCPPVLPQPPFTDPKLHELMSRDEDQPRREEDRDEERVPG